MKTKLSIFCCCLNFFPAFCLLNNHTFSVGPSIVEMAQFSVSEDVKTIFKASTTKSNDTNYPNVDLRSVIEILACCRTLKQRQAINEAFKKEHKKSIVETFFPGNNTPDPKLKTYFEYMFYDSTEIMTRSIRSSLLLNLDYGWRSIIATSDCDQIKAITSKYKELFSTNLIEEIKKRGKFENDEAAKTYYLNMADPKKYCRPNSTSTLDVVQTNPSDSVIIPRNTGDCALLNLTDILAKNSFSYIRKMINTDLQANTETIAYFCTGFDGLNDAYRRIFLFSGERSNYFAQMELATAFDQFMRPVQDTLTRVFLLRSEIDLCGVRTKFWSNYEEILTLFPKLNRTQFSELYVYAISQTLCGNRKDTNVKTDPALTGVYSK